MKTLQKCIYLLTISLFIAVTANAGEVASTFTSGDTLTATKMTEIKDAVNDNNSRVGAIETQTQNLVRGCVAGQSIRAIAVDGTVTCEVDDVSADGSDTLAGLSCASGQVAKWNGTIWACAADDNTGDITGVTAGTGLLGGGTTGNVELKFDSTTVQARVADSCIAGQSIRAINDNGMVTCEVDSDSGGDITSIDTAADSGLTGGSTSGSVNLRLANGFVSVHPAAFISREIYDTVCYPVTERNYHFFHDLSTKGICKSFASVNLPHNADISSIQCYFQDSHATEDITVTFRRTTFSTGATTDIATMNTTGANTTAMLTRTSNFTIQTVNNATFAYSIEFDPGNTTLVSSNHRIYGCSITYSY